MLSPSPGFMSPTLPLRSGRHQAKRSITDTKSPTRPKGHVTRHSLQHNLQKDRPLHDERDHQQPHSRQRSLDIPRVDMATRSRRNSALIRQPEETGFQASSGQLLLESKAVKISKGELLKLERDTAARRAEDLKQSLLHLHTFSTNAHRRLDQTYFAVLEKMSALQTTISALRDLAESSRDIYRTFEKDSRELETEVTNQLDALGYFDEQQSKVEGLQARIHEGRARVQALSSRVDAVRERVESWERADQSWQGRTRRRLKYTWIFLTTVALVVMVLVLSFRYGASDSPLASLDEIIASTAGMPGQAWRGDLGSTPPAHDGEGSQMMKEPLFLSTTVLNDDRLRGLDEL